MHFFRKKQSRAKLVRILTPGAPAVAAVALLLAFGTRPGPSVALAERISSSSNLDSLLVNASTLTESFREISDSVSRLLHDASSLPVALPTDGLLSSGYNHRRLHPIRNVSMPHYGIDVAAPAGTPVVAPAAGVVTRVERAAGYGLLVEVNHGNGILTRYAHLSRTFVKPGFQVMRGAKLAAVGNSGISTGPHLHYEIIVNGSAVDPLIYINHESATRAGAN